MTNCYKITFVILLVVLLTACKRVPTPTPNPTLDALSTQSVRQAQQLSTLETESARLAEQLSALATISLYQSTQVGAIFGEMPRTPRPAARLTSTPPLPGEIVSTSPFLPNCQPVPGENQAPPTSPSESQPGWSQYTNLEVGFAFSFPPGWTILEGSNYLCLAPKDTPSTTLLVGFKRQDEPISITLSGVGAGEIENRGQVNFMGKPVFRDVLTFQGKDKAVLYSQAQEIPVGELVFSLRLDNLNRDYEPGSILQPIQSLVDQIVESFTFP